jgi:acyl-CoA reductase-like NAD-dependent aldehyde dehydrogenase
MLKLVDTFGKKHFASVAKHSLRDVKAMMPTVKQAGDALARMSIEQRLELCRGFLTGLEKHSGAIAHDITKQMGKPLAQAKNEVRTLKERTEAMMELAPSELATEIIGDGREIRQEPLGTVLVIAPWNYPMVTAANAIIPAILSGNSVLIKPSMVTPLCGKWFEDLFCHAPEGAVKNILLEHHDIAALVEEPAIQHVSFTGSVAGGRAVYQTVASKRFIDCTLELGGKDPVYLAPDADLLQAVPSIVDGAFYNAGQSCCGVERAYVHQDVYDEFMARATPLVNGYAMGDPMLDSTTLGPIALEQSLDFLKNQVEQAVRLGGTVTTSRKADSPFFPPVLVGDCTHQMSIMTEESFGPVLGVQKVSSDQAALELMNQSNYGLTAGVYTQCESRIQWFTSRLQAGTVFANRCDYLDPFLPWSGVKDTGKGHSLSRHGFFTRFKSVNIKK